MTSSSLFWSDGSTSHTFYNTLSISNELLVLGKVISVADLSFGGGLVRLLHAKTSEMSTANSKVLVYWVYIHQSGHYILRQCNRMA